MSDWHLGKLCPFDTESTGLDLENEQIVTATVAHIEPGKSTVVDSWLIAVDRDISTEATKVHGITTEHARANGRPAAECLDMIAAGLAFALNEGTPIVGMNLVFDFTLLDRELRRHDLPTLEDRIGRAIAPVIDVYVIDKWVDQWRPGGRKLADQCKAYGVRIDGLHDAEFDAMGAARVAYRIGQRANMPRAQVQKVYADAKRIKPWEIAETFGKLGRMSLDELHAAQIEWRAEQQKHLEEHFTEQGKVHEPFLLTWPIHPFVESAALA